MKFRDVQIFSGQRFQVPQSIQRIDHKATHGWQLRYGGTKLYSDHSNDGSGAAAALEKAIAELKRRTAKLPAPTRLQSGPSRHKGSDLPVGISGPVVRQRKGSSVRDCSLSVSLPRFAGKPQRRSVYIGTENTYSVERYQAALAKAIALRAEAEAQYREAETRSRRAETRVLDPKTDSQPLRKRAAVKAPAVQATVAKKPPAGKKTTAAKAVGKAGSRKAAGASAHA